ncbi:MAG: hypothetical protein OQJ77_03015, partial [Thiovulaceae bacterium]|nr:hypothetical protein [Sulfurimonadaceae bacterium]
MKIENFSIGMQSQHSKSTQVSNLFEQELFSLSMSDNIQSNNTQELNITNKESEFTQRLGYIMVQQFISSIQSISTKQESFGLNIRSIEDIQKDLMYNGYSGNNNQKELDINSLEPRELMFQEVSLTQEVIHQESLDLQMDGWVQTDTQKIKLDIDLSFSSTFVQRHQLTKTMFFDPLVLNFDGEIPNLDKQKFSFDIDCDGESDQISKLSEGCGFLALDKNNNNSIDDGTELFGTQNGNGFY